MGDGLIWGLDAENKTRRSDVADMSHDYICTKRFGRLNHSYSSSTVLYGHQGTHLFGICFVYHWLPRTTGHRFGVIHRNIHKCPSLSALTYTTPLLTKRSWHLFRRYSSIVSSWLTFRSTEMLVCPQHAADGAAFAPSYLHRPESGF